MDSSPKSEIILYQPNETVSLEVRMESETVWLNRNQIAMLFGRDVKTIGKHINNALREELQNMATVANFATVQNEGGRVVKRSVEYYNLDMVLSVGYRVKSPQGVLFRQWANKVLKEYMLRGYSINQRFERLEQRVAQTENKIDFFVRTSLPPVEGLMHEGQIFDARVCVENLIKQAKREVIMIDGYVDAATFEILDVRQKDVSATIYTERVGESLLRIKELHDSQYPDKTIELKKYAENFHDRFLIIDDVVYHFGASFKDLGNRLFAFNKMGLDKNLILSAVKEKFEKPKVFRYGNHYA
ncbi:MAG: virulence RhuM family protein [Bacteroidales bacterium]|nr:virulence RhuM family protein [Bacteroidales bacterium]